MPASHPSRRSLAAGLALAAIAIVAPRASAQTRAARVASATDLLTGQSAQGRIGDFVLENDVIRVVIDDIPNPHGFADTGGNVIDAARQGREDLFASLFTMFNNRFGRQARYATLEIVDAGGPSATARIRVTGADSEVPSIAVVTEYSLAPGSDHVRVETTLVNGGAQRIPQIQVGDAIQWGLTTHFAPGWDNYGRNVPGDGHDIGGKVLEVDWVAGDGFGASYGYAGFSGIMELANGSTWSDGNIAYLDLPPGGSGSYARAFFVGDGSIASVADSVQRLRGTVVGTLRGRVTEQVTGVPIAEATIAITTRQCLGTVGATSQVLARSAADGAWSADVPPGTYSILVEALGRSSSSCATVSVLAGQDAIHDVALPAQATFSWTCTDGARPIPCKISILELPATTDRREGPKLGDNHSLQGGYAILSPEGSGTTAVPPGSYQVWASRGIEWDAHVQEVTLAAGGTGRVDAALSRVVDTNGWISADLHVHAQNSADSGVTFEMRAQQAACEGLEIVVPTDHDFISDMGAAIASTGLGEWVGTFPGNEVTTVAWGHHNAYPLTPDPTAPRNGALEHGGMTPGEMFAALREDPKDPVIQVNHPRAGGLGYFDLAALNPVTGTSPHPDWSADFDAIEVFNGKRLYQVPEVLADWYHLLNEGRQVAGIGNTDTHQVFSQEIGYPRNFVLAGTDVPGAVSETEFRDAVKAGRALFTNGPFVEHWVEGVPMGGLATARSSAVDVRIRVQAASWVATDRAEIVVNGRVERTLAIPSGTQALRMDETVSLDVPGDSWIAVRIVGGSCELDSNDNCLVPGCPGRLDPIVPPLYGTVPACPFAHSNPVRVDADGDGRWSPPGNRGLFVEPIADVRPVGADGVHVRLGETVTVRGVVTAGSYTFDHRSNLVYFQDESLDASRVLSGGMATYNSGLISPELEAGDEVEITGRITQFSGLTELVDLSIEVLRDGGPVPDPIELTVDDLRDAARYEQWEGMLVRLSGVTITGGTWPAFGDDANITIRDGSGTRTLTMRVDADTNVDGSAPPSQPFDLIAVVGQFAFSSPYVGWYQLLPRTRADIIESGDAVTLHHRPAADDVTSCSAVIRWYTNHADAGRVEWGETPALGSTVTEGAASTSHAVLLDGLRPGTMHHVRVVASSGASHSLSFTTAAAVTPAIIDGPRAAVVGPSVVQVRWRTDVPSTSVVEHGEGTPSVVVTGAPGTEHLVTLTGLEPGTTHAFRVVSESPACGGGIVTSSIASFTTPACDGARAPAWLRAEAGRGVVGLSWEGSLAGGEYLVLRAAGDCGGVFRAVATVPAGDAVVSWDDFAVEAGVTACYAVSAMTGECASEATRCTEMSCAVPVGGSTCPPGDHPVISQVQHAGPGGGCDEFVELYNPTAASWDLTGHALRYQSATNAPGAAGIEFPDGLTIPPHGYLLIAAAGWTGGTPDVVMSCGMAAAGGHLSLIQGLDPLTFDCPPALAASIVLDRVGWGTASCPEGNAAPSFASGASLQRGPGGADGHGADTDDNASDFLAGAPQPRSRSTIASCHSAGASRPVEVSAASSSSPLLLRKQGADVFLAFQQLADADGYNVYAGNLGVWYSHGLDPDCDVVTSPAGAGRLETTWAAAPGNLYVLVSAFNATGEGETGARGDGRAIPTSEATCVP